MCINRLPAAEVDESKYSPLGNDDSMRSIGQEFGVGYELVGWL